MNFVPLTPALVGATMSILLLIGGRQHRVVTDDAEIYRYPAAWGYMMFACALLFSAAPFIPGAQGDMGFLAFASFFWAFASFAVLMGVYMLKYRVVLTADDLTLGALFHRRIPKSEIVEVQLVNTRRPQLFLKLASGSKVRLSGLLTDFMTLATRLSDAQAGKAGSK